MFEDVIMLVSSQAVIHGHLGLNVPMDVVSNYRKENPIDVEKFGLFDSSSPNYTNYYPDVKADDLVPKDGELATPLVRALSEVVVHKGYNPVDFSQNNVLKNAVQKLVGQSVYVDHETALGNALGVVYETSWEEGYTATNGKKVPAGINARLKIDGKSNPRLVRLMNMDPPAVHSLSVTVRFKWAPSHPSIPMEEFVSKLGTYDDKGQMYRRIATEISSFSEISFVGHGADPYAQIIKDGNIVNPEYADLVYNSADGKPYVKSVFYDFRALDTISNSTTIPIISNNNKPPIQMKAIIALLCAHFQVSPEAVSEDKVDAQFLPQLQKALADATALEANQEKVTGLETQVSNLEQEVENLKAEAMKAPAFTKIGEKAQEELLTEVKRLNGIVGNTPESLEPLIASANYETLSYLKNMFSLQADEKMPLTCKSCGSHEVNRASAVPNNPGGGDEAKPNIITRLRNKRLEESTKMIASQPSISTTGK